MRLLLMLPALLTLSACDLFDSLNDERPDMAAPQQPDVSPSDMAEPVEMTRPTEEMTPPIEEMTPPAEEMTPDMVADAAPDMPTPAFGERDCIGAYEGRRWCVGRDETWALGELDGLTIQNGALTLAPDTTEGTYTTPVVDLIEASTAAALIWTPLSPYGVPMPAEGGRDNERYAQDNLSMEGNVLLLRFDQGDQGTQGLRDYSGKSLVLQERLEDGASIRLAPGRVDDGLQLDASAYLSAPNDHPSLNFGFEDFTWALWVKMTQRCDSNRVLMGVEDRVDANRTHMWLGCRDQASDPTCTVDGAAGGTFGDANDTSGAVVLCGSTPINDGEWHHLVVRKSATQLKLYVDGQEERSIDHRFDAPFTFEGAKDFVLGGFNYEPRYNTSATLDELAIWHRALSTDEIGSLYRRGAVRASLRLRVCNDATCSTDPAFRGPPGELTYADKDPVVYPPRHILNSPQPKRYMQLQVLMRAPLGEQPVVGALEIRPSR